MARLSTSWLAPDLWLTAAYPAMTCRIAAGYVITVEGTRGYPVAIRLQGVGAARFRRIATSSGVAVPVRRAAGALAFQGPGDERYTIAF